MGFSVRGLPLEQKTVQRRSYLVVFISGGPPMLGNPGLNPGPERCLQFFRYGRVWQENGGQVLDLFK